ncbi:hypothetical protein ACHHYP_10539 [Achlya hypogyna]|uniref:Uncharacterized protein n=1 Tax=Achlya hypogyna TaxID=1202772 RepID=A0A1V9YL47_ACHHY|nr:hypothetical protein ACHHYP_10539 [Achlya hypogyna]
MQASPMAEMTRDEFVQALAQALAANEANMAQPKSDADVALDTYDALQFDFPVVTAADVRTLAMRMHGPDRSRFPVTRPLFLNALELSGKTDASLSAAAATLLVQCYCRPFEDPAQLAAFRFEGDPSPDAKLLFVCYHTTYAPLSGLSGDDWNHFQVTDSCCAIAAQLLHRSSASDAGMLLRLEWARYLYLLRDRMLQLPATCPVILPRVAAFFEAHSIALDEAAALALPRLLLELAASQASPPDVTTSAMASGAVLAALKPQLPAMTRLLDARGDAVAVVAQLALWATQRQPAMWVPLLFDHGLLRGLVGCVATEPTTATLRALVMAALFSADFSAYLHAVPSMARWRTDPRFKAEFAAEYALWSLALELAGDATAFYDQLAALFPATCTSALAARLALRDAVFVVETLGALQRSRSARWTAWPARAQLAPALSRLLPDINQRFAFPVKDTTAADDADDGANAHAPLVNQLRKAIKEASQDRGSAKLD